MRVLFVPYPMKTHLHHQVPLAWALLAAGHEVRVAAQPELLGEVLAAGLPAAALAAPLRWEEAVTSLPSADPARTGLDLSDLRPGGNSFEYLYTRMAVLATYPLHELCVRPVVAELVDFARSWRPDLVVWDETMFAAPIAARACGAAHARLLTSLDVLGQLRADFLAQLARRPAGLRHDPWREWLGWNLEQVGAEFAEDAVTGHFTLNSQPVSVQYPLPGHVPFRYVPYYGGAVTPPEYDRPAERRRVCLTFGLCLREAVGMDAEGLTELLEATAEVDAEVIATVGALPEGYRPPPNVRTPEFVPLNSLLPTCSAIVHHGGAGTGLSALLHGVPQILVPDGAWDTVPRAEALAALGAGAHVRKSGFDPHALASTLTEVLDEPSYTEVAAGLRAEMLAAPSPAGLVPRLVELTEEFRGAA